MFVYREVTSTVTMMVWGVGKKHGEGLYNIKEMVFIFNIRGEGFDNWLKMSIYVR